MDKATAKQRKRFEKTLFLIHESCTNNDEMVIPHLTKKEMIVAMGMLNESMCLLQDLLLKIQVKGGLKIAA